MPCTIAKAGGTSCYYKLTYHKINLKKEKRKIFKFLFVNFEILFTSFKIFFRILRFYLNRLRGLLKYLLGNLGDVGEIGKWDILFKM